MRTILSLALTCTLLLTSVRAAAQEESSEATDTEETSSEMTEATDEGEEAADDVASDEASADAADPAAPAAPADASAAAPARPSDAPVAAKDNSQNVEGAPLGNSNVYVHIVEKQPYTNAGRHEVVLYPAVAQVNSKFNVHIGAAAMYSYHLFENLALQVTPLFNYVNQESAFNQELIRSGRQQAQAATALLMQYGAVAGVEVTPMYGKFAFYEGVLGHFTFVLNAGAGAGSTRIQLRPDTDGCATGQGECLPASFGDTGFKFLGQVGAGFRVFLGERVALRLEVRDLIYTARVDKINGCTHDDIDALDKGLAATSASCNAAAFANDADMPLARKLLEETSSDVLNNISFYGGVSFLF